uniref:Uncharacterized protein n=1 Tax=Salix viminalis TaxID=40686 RepID=A0A6N2N2C4_SALVM
MYCNDPTSARQAMCFYYDPISSSLAFDQFPQRFHNISKHDIHDRQLRSTFGVHTMTRFRWAEGTSLVWHWLLYQEEINGDSMQKGNND